MCLLLKLDYAKCGVSNFIFQNYRRKTFVRKVKEVLFVTLTPKALCFFLPVQHWRRGEGGGRENTPSVKLDPDFLES